MTIPTLTSLIAFARDHIRDESERIMYYLKFIDLMVENNEFLPEELSEAIGEDLLLKKVLDEYRRTHP